MCYNINRYDDINNEVTYVSKINIEVLKVIDSSMSKCYNSNVVYNINTYIMRKIKEDVIWLT